jgi:hypothetical protein
MEKCLKAIFSVAKPSLWAVCDRYCLCGPDKVEDKECSTEVETLQLCSKVTYFLKKKPIIINRPNNCFFCNKVIGAFYRQVISLTILCVVWGGEGKTTQHFHFLKNNKNIYTRRIFSSFRLKQRRSSSRPKRACTNSWALRVPFWHSEGWSS